MMPTEKSSAEDAKALSDPKGSTQNGSVANVAKSDGSKPDVGEIRKRAYKIFQERHGGSEIGDWQKAEAALSGDAAKAQPPKPETTKPDAAKADSSESDEPKREASKEDVRMPTDSGTIEEALSKFKSNIEHGLTQGEAASRLKQDGPNAIEERHINPFMRFLKFLWGP